MDYPVGHIASAEKETLYPLHIHIPTVSDLKKADYVGDKIKNIAVAYQENQVEIYNALNNEFIDDLPKWNASIDKHTLSFQFNAPEVLFGVGKSNINVIFQNILKICT